MNDVKWLHVTVSDDEHGGRGQVHNVVSPDAYEIKEYKIDNIDAAAEVVRDAVTVYAHPAHVEAAAKVDTHRTRR